ncbi:MAG: pyrroloquinoline quinone-dependent dehydrogenase [Xanthobacteraceae bacterium]
MRPMEYFARTGLSVKLLGALPIVLGVIGALADLPRAMAGETLLQQLKPITDENLKEPAPGDWLMRRGDYRAWGYSALNQIRADNVGRLRLAWAWNMEPGYQEEAPLAHDGIIFLGNPNNVVQALDGRTGDLLWEYRRDLPKIEGGYHNDLLNRARGTIALYADKVLLATADAHVLALDAKTGKVVWDTLVADYRQGYTFTGGPMVAKGKVIAGISGCTNPTTAGGCFIVALDVNTGAELWRTHTIAQPGSPGDESWHGLPREQRNGGSVWTSGSYDPALNLLYWGTGGPIPHAEFIRGTGDGAVLYTDSTLALDADTGNIVWYRQFLPRDNWNFDHVFEQVLVDINVDNRPRQALLAIGKPGIIWALDRRTGEFLWARETVQQTLYKSIDPETGHVALNESLIPRELAESKFVCPSNYGGKLWMATAYNPTSKTLFVPLNNLCMDYKVVEQKPLIGEDYGRGRMVFRHVPGDDQNIGRVEAVNLDNKQTQWKHERRPYWSSSLLATAGGIVFGGDTNRRITAFDAATGKTLWEMPLNSQPGGFPMTYMVGGKQYVAIPTGLSLIGNRVVRALTPEIAVPSRGSTLLVFALPDAN